MWRPRRELSNARVVLTGASSGIGWALAECLAREGVRLVLGARREDRLQQLAKILQARGGEVELVVGDVTEEPVRTALLATSQRAFGGLDGIINNAGSGALGPFVAADAQRLRHMMEVNFFAPAELVRAAIPALRASQDGFVVNVGSVLGHFAVPQKSEYCASKFALHGLTDALHMELRTEAIDVMLVSPSTTASEFFEVAQTTPGVTASKRRAMSAAAVAAQTVRAIQRRRREVILSPGGRALVWADRLFPELTSRLLRRFT